MSDSETSGNTGVVASGEARPSDSRSLLRRIPPVGRLLEDDEITGLFRLYGRNAVTVQLQAEIAALREQISKGALATIDDLEEQVAVLGRRTQSELSQHFGTPVRRVLNATGVFLHTNLGRSPLPAAVVEGLPSFLDAYCDLEMDLVTGKRANRNSRVERQLCALTGAEAAVVVNNNAAALVLMLQSAARSREVVVSRGELVEIGGSFRVPSILETAGCTLREVGTTNRTRVSDYAEAIGPETGALLKVHPSNYVISGFVEEVSASELVQLGREHQVPVLIDEGSGLLQPSSAPQLRDHESLQQLITAGVDGACGSGDKLVGGPQAGLIVGRSAFIGELKRHPLYRALRPNRATLFALESVLRMHLVGDALPIDRLWVGESALRKRLEPVAAELGAQIVPCDAFVGGGAAPEAEIPGLALALNEPERLLASLRVGEPAVVGYMKDDLLILDLRTVDPSDDSLLVAAVHSARAQMKS